MHGPTRSPASWRPHRRPSAEASAVSCFLADKGEERIRAAYPGSTWDRLAVIKRRYDPTNLFRLNQNIPPATAGVEPIR